MRHSIATVSLSGMLREKLQAAAAAVQGIEELVRGSVGVRSLQSFHESLAAWREGR